MTKYSVASRRVKAASVSMDNGQGSGRVADRRADVVRMLYRLPLALLRITTWQPGESWRRDDVVGSRVSHRPGTGKRHRRHRLSGNWPPPPSL